MSYDFVDGLEVTVLITVEIAAELINEFRLYRYRAQNPLPIAIRQNSRVRRGIAVGFPASYITRHRTPVPSIVFHDRDHPNGVRRQHVPVNPKALKKLNLIYRKGSDPIQGQSIQVDVPLWALNPTDAARKKAR